MLNRIIVILLITIGAFASYADEVLVIKDIKISATDKNATLARNAAIEKGQLRAFAELIKLDFPAATNKAASLKRGQILNLVEGFELADEKRSATHYLAKITVRFNRASVELLMSNLGAAYHPRKDDEVIIATNNEVNSIKATPLLSEAAPAMDSLIIPVFEKFGQVYWFDEENEWLSFWHQQLKAATSNQFVLPLGDLEDLSLLNKNILNKNIIDLSSLFERYNINNIAIVKLTVNDEMSVKSASMSIDYINRFHHAWQQYMFHALPGDNLALIMPEYFSDLNKFKFNANQSFADSLELIPAKTIAVEYSISKLSDWVDLEQTLRSIRYITSIELKSMNLQHYSFSLTYNVELQKLQNILASYNLTLVDNGEDQYQIVKEALDAKY